MSDQSPDEIAAMADQAVRDLVQRLDSDSLSTGKFVLLAETINTHGERVCGSVPPLINRYGMTLVYWNTQ